MDVDVEVVVVSHPVQVLSHCRAIETDEHRPAANRRSHLARGKAFTLLAHLCGVEVVEVIVEVVVLVDVKVDVELLVDEDVDVLVEVLVDDDVDVLVEVLVDVVEVLVEVVVVWHPLHVFSH